MFAEALCKKGAPPSRASDTTPIAKPYLKTGWGEACSRFHRSSPEELCGFTDLGDRSKFVYDRQEQRFSFVCRIERIKRPFRRNKVEIIVSYIVIKLTLSPVSAAYSLIQELS